jgi:hypothetical protein
VSCVCVLDVSYVRVLDVPYVCVLDVSYFPVIFILLAAYADIINVIKPSSRCCNKLVSVYPYCLAEHQIFFYFTCIEAEGNSKVSCERTFRTYFSIHRFYYFRYPAILDAVGRIGGVNS